MRENTNGKITHIRLRDLTGEEGPLARNKELAVKLNLALSYIPVLLRNGQSKGYFSVTKVEGHERFIRWLIDPRKKWVEVAGQVEQSGTERVVSKIDGVIVYPVLIATLVNTLRGFPESLRESAMNYSLALAREPE